MIKITQLLTVFCTIFLLLGCDRSNEHKSYEELIADYQHLNSLLYPVTAQSKNAVWPFSDLYLSSRNNILNQLLKASQSEAEVVLLTIEQRFTERFFPWPYNTNPVLNYINTVPKIDDAALAKFIVFSQQQMSASYHDKVRLSEFELSSLRHQVNEAKALLSPYGKSFTALTQFEVYLDNYSPRRRPGIGSLPNGKDWYQARLNYFVGSAKKPNDILVHLLAVKPQLQTETRFLKCYTTDNCNNTFGLDWRTGYSHRLTEFKDIPFGIEQAIIAEVDYGIHAQLWSSEHALTVLRKELKLNQAQANVILARLIKEPALAMVNFPLDK